MTLTEISAKIYATLLREAGTQEFWNETDIKVDINYLYQDTARGLLCCKKRDTSVSSVISTARYVIPVVSPVSSVLKLHGMTYDSKPLDYTTPEELNDLFGDSWRSAGDGTPIACYYEKGDENLAITLYPPPSAVKTLGFDISFLPVELTDSASPENPFTDGTMLHDGVVSMELSKPGGGRDLDRSEFWYGMFIAGVNGLSKHVGFGNRCLRSIEESTPTRSFGGRLPSNYPINQD